MAKKYGLITGLDDEKKKTKYQVFEAVTGFEHVEVLIPFENADAFQEEALEKKPKSAASLKKLASKFGGRVDG